MQLPNDSSFRLCETNDGSWQFLRAGDHWVTYLGLEKETSRFVTISFSSGLENQQSMPGQSSSLRRVERLAGVNHPVIGRVYETGVTSSGNSYVVTEFVEGEPLIPYLQRNRNIPGNLLACLLSDLAEGIAVLASHPRFLSCVELGDFAVVLDRGIYPVLRLSRFGLDREECPSSDYQLADQWARAIAAVHSSMISGEDPASYSSVAQYPSAYQKYLQSLQNTSGFEAIGHLNEMGAFIREAAGVGELNHASPLPLRGKIKELKQACQGPLQELLFHEKELRKEIGSSYELRPGETRYGVSPFVIPAARMDESGVSTGELVHLYFLPPERLFDGSLIEPLNRKMFDSYLKAHPNGVRVRSLRCEEDYTMVVADRFEGLPLPILQARREKMSPDDVVLIIRQIDRVLSHFEDANFGLKQVFPWQIEIYFESAAPGQIPQLLEKTPVREWPAWDIKLRVEPPAEVFIEPALSAWSHILKQCKGKTIPSMVAWLLSGDRFDWAIRSGTVTDEPLSWNPHLDQCMRAAADTFEDEKSEHRKRLIAFLIAVFDRNTDESGIDHGFGKDRIAVSQNEDDSKVKSDLSDERQSDGTIL